uniref:Uncharacterized protein n=1 Tax=Cacopsylla melanoneura TaxID=428564 RepID=A0A8D8ZM83_9HEMI
MKIINSKSHFMYDDMDSSTKYVTFRKTDDRIRKHKSALKRKNEHAPQKKIIGINLPFTKIKSSRFSARHIVLEKKIPKTKFYHFCFTQERFVGHRLHDIVFRSVRNLSILY